MRKKQKTRHPTRKAKNETTYAKNKKRDILREKKQKTRHPTRKKKRDILSEKQNKKNAKMVGGTPKQARWKKTVTK